MKAVAAMLILLAVAACTWLVADGDRERLAAWAEQWTAGAIHEVDALHRRVTALEADLKAAIHDAAHVDELAQENAALRLQLADQATELDAALHRQPEVVVVHIPLVQHRKHRHHAVHRRAHCHDDIANELNAAELR